MVFNCAGYVAHGSILDCGEDAWARSFELNVTSMFRICKAALPAMLARGSGSIVNVASVASSVKGVPERFAYGASKAAVIGLTRSIAADFVARGVRCNAIAPGTIATPSLRERMAALPGDPDAAERAFMRGSRWAGWARPRRWRRWRSIWRRTRALSPPARCTFWTAGGPDEPGPGRDHARRAGGKPSSRRHRHRRRWGRLVWSCGDVERPIYPRSAVKMLQALTLVE